MRRECTSSWWERDLGILRIILTLIKIPKQKKGGEGRTRGRAGNIEIQFRIPKED